jgi:hypothetical protein
MAAFPELAPDDQNHMLRTTTVLKSIEYTDDRITYTKFDARSAERLKMGAWTPARVQGGKKQWDAKTKVLTISATAGTVTISK